MKLVDRQHFVNRDLMHPHATPYMVGLLGDTFIIKGAVHPTTDQSLQNQPRQI